MPRVLYTLGDDISTDIVYPGRYMATVLPTETPQFAFADIKELNTMLNEKKYPADSVIIGGKNFGCGSSREQAVSTLKGHDLIIIARNFARIFFQNSINLGLRIITCPDIDARKGDELEITPTEVINTSTGTRFQVLPLPRSRQAIIEAGGLIAYTRQRVMAKVQ